MVDEFGNKREPNLFEREKIDLIVQALNRASPPPKEFQPHAASKPRTKIQ